MSALDDDFQKLVDAVANDPPKQSAVLVLQHIADMVEGSATSPQGVELAAKIRDNAEALGAAIANTGPAPVQAAAAEQAAEAETAA